MHVERHYAPGLPPIEAMAGELNQVWTNLVDNAIDAMDGHGTLARLAPRPARPPGWVVVEIADTGPGMTPEVRGPRVRAVLHDQGGRQGHRPRALDISRRIVVERHSGDIDHRRRPGWHAGAGAPARTATRATPERRHRTTEDDR